MRRAKQGGSMIQIRKVSILLLIFVWLLCTLSCGKKEGSSVVAKAPKDTTSDTAASELIPLEAISSAATRDAQSGPLMLPTSFGRRTGDLDQMIKERRIRALVVINPISFFYSHGKPNGITYEALEQLAAP
jgi:hypothetical protein